MIKRNFPESKKQQLKFKDDSEVLLVIGIGGSYLGARAAIEMLQHSFHNLLSSKQRKHLKFCMWVITLVLHICRYNRCVR